MVMKVSTAVLLALKPKNGGFVGPKTPLEVLAGNDLAGLFQQRLQDLEWLLLHFQTDAVFVELASLKVEFEYAEPLF